MKEVEKVVQNYLETTQLPLRGFAEELTQSIKLELSHASVLNWSSGKSTPSTDFLLQLLIAHDDWRRLFAWECLQAKLPEVFGDTTLYWVLKDLNFRVLVFEGGE